MGDTADRQARTQSSDTNRQQLHLHGNEIRHSEANLNDATRLIESSPVPCENYCQKKNGRNCGIHKPNSIEVIIRTSEYQTIDENSQANMVRAINQRQSIANRISKVMKFSA